MARKRWAAVAAAASVATILAILVPMGLASGSASTGSFNGLVSGGNLLLHFSNLNDSKNPGTTYFKQQDLAGGPFFEHINNPSGSTTTFTTTSPDYNLMAVSAFDTKGNASNVGAETAGGLFVGLGVAAKSGNGTDNGRVDFVASSNSSEKLVLTLADGIQPSGAKLTVTAAELDVDVKGTGATVIANLYNGSTLVGTEKLITSNSDSGPDAGTKDNFAFPLNANVPSNCATAETQSNATVCGTFGAFNKIVLSSGWTSAGGNTTPSNTSFALEGGPHGTALDPTSPYTWDTTKLRATIGTTDSAFSLLQSDGVLNCGDTVQAGNGTDSFTRGTSNKDGSNCVVVNYDYNNTISVNNTVQLLWDTSSQPSATFSLTQTWEPEDSVLDANGQPVPSKFTKVQWDTVIGEIPAPACTSTALPSTYGTLNATLLNTDTTIQIALASGVTARNDAFNLQIGAETISIPAQTPNVSGGVATYIGIVRGAGNTPVPASDAVGTKVMTTPFPIVGTGSSAFVAKMCLATSSWVTTGVMGTNGYPQLQVTDTILAEGDATGHR